MRKDTLRCFRATRYSPLCDTIWQNRWKKLNPSEPLHDPYIVALLIAVAQEKRRHLHEADFTLERQNTFFSVCLPFQVQEYKGDADLKPP